MDYATLDLLKQNHPAWRMLRSDHAPLVASFLNHAFIVPNVRVMSQADLVELLEDQLFDLRELPGGKAFPKSALEYLNDWAGNDKGWLRKFYPPGSDEPHFDLTPATEKAIRWLSTLRERSFVGTESRLWTLLELLRQICHGSEADPEARIADLLKRRDEINLQIDEIRRGGIRLMDDTAIKDRFQQFVHMARELLTDFREVEENFRQLDRQVREQIALWDGAKGTLLEQIMGERDAIANSDQGRSFHAFWIFLMSQQRQEEWTQLLETALALAPVKEMRPESRLRRVHYDWLEAGEHTQRTVAHLSGQLRRFLDDKAWIENRRIMELLHEIEASALAVRDHAPAGDFVSIAETASDIDLPMERPLFTPPNKIFLKELDVTEGEGLLDMSALFSQVVVRKRDLVENIRRELQTRSQISLREILQAHPLQHGLAELVTYLQIAAEWAHIAVEENLQDVVEWQAPDGRIRRAQLPRILFARR